jgi:branched-subunit amino acid aminotransferase/4-amino-4-deoxychorismate lyase
LPACDKSWGIVETVRVEAGRLVLPSYHYQRLSTTADAFGICLPFDYKEFKSLLEGACRHSQCLVRLTLYRDATFKVEDRLCKKRSAVRLATVKGVVRRYHAFSQYKTLDTVELSLKALRLAERAGADDALLFSSNHFVCETAFANVFFVKEGVFFTPAIETGCVAGTRRRFVMDILRAFGVPCVEGFFTLSQLMSAEEVFITSAREDAVPVVAIDRTRLNHPGENSWCARIRRTAVALSANGFAELEDRQV